VSKTPAIATIDAKIAETEPLSRLLLDVTNPRFGGQQSGLIDQAAVLDHIVNTYGIDDVISSLAVNGYFKAEPLVGKVDGKNIKIIEGNRRLAACLILSNDDRAKNQAIKGASYRELWKRHGSKNINVIPVISFPENADDAELLSYLGVRHISASAPWDSYAKAHWAAQVVQSTKLTVNDISTMIGDPHRTVARLLEGYYVVQQAVKTGHFIPSDCVRNGRGSVTEYPFSWVYTILGYTAAREFVQMPDDGPKPNPIPTDRLDNVAFMMRAMFGSKSVGMNAVIRDSRALGNLASAFYDREKVAYMQGGMMLDEVNRLTKPVDERITENLAEVRRLQAELVSVISSSNVGNEVAESNLSLANGNRRAAAAIEKSLKDIVYPDDAL
jgi:hypothetical protein